MCGMGRGFAEVRGTGFVLYFTTAWVGAGAKLDYRPTPKQRSLLELLQYLTIMAPIHLGGVMGKTFDMAAWRAAWQSGEAKAAVLSLEEVKEAIAAQDALFTERLERCTDAELREEVEMFGSKASRGSMIVALILTHLTAYRMQLFLYLKGSGREELNTMNLWVGVDGKVS